VELGEVHRLGESVTRRRQAQLHPSFMKSALGTGPQLMALGTSARAEDATDEHHPHAPEHSDEQALGGPPAGLARARDRR